MSVTRRIGGQEVPYHLLAMAGAYLPPTEKDVLRFSNVTGVSIRDIARQRFSGDTPTITLRDVQECGPTFTSDAKITLGDRFFNGTCPSKRLLPDLVRRFPNVVELNLILTSDLSTEDLPHLAFLPQLRTLNIVRGAYFVETRLTANDIAVFASLPQLRTLGLATLPVVSDDTLKTLAQSSPKFQALDLTHCPISDPGLIALSACQNLQALNLDGCYNVGDEGVIPLIRSCRGMQALNLRLTSISDRTLTELVESCERLQNLNISTCNPITKVGLLALARYKQLQKLNLASIQSLSDDELIAIAESNRGLRRLDLETCKLLTNRSLEALSKLCPELRSLCLFGCDKITDQGLAYLGNLPRLQDVNLVFCNRTTQAGRDQLSRPGLTIASEARNIYSRAARHQEDFSWL